MKWEGHEQSDRVEDRRGMGAGGGMRGPGGGGRKLGLGAIVVALVAGWLFGINPMTVLGLLGGEGGLAGGAPTSQTPPAGAAAPLQDKPAVFTSTVFKDTERVWTQLFQAAGSRYEAPTLVLFRGATPTACGSGNSAMGPFYCPGDGQIYIDLDFFDTLSRRLGAPGDFAQAYVIAHEVAHHVQNLMGVTGKVDALRGRSSQAQQNAMSVRVELQADCLAGVWAHHSQRSKGWLEPGDIEEGLRAAAQIGDDTLQKASQGHVVPESFTHGTSAQRVSWFRRGLEGGSIAQCDTFARAR
ncbi:metalloprotease [beta proteobacterium AAP121]|nr:metalloprotease [beta proteobacterium AAP65]KPG00264.1 metalloprotease [beta proteobacterium AAP121]